MTPGIAWGVEFVLLVSRPGSPYADTSRSYEYPARYQKLFRPLESGDPMIAILYGPGDESGRRMAYIGWTALRSAPERSQRTTVRGEPQWVVRYVDEIQYFPNPVPFRYLGEAMEKFIRESPTGTPDMRGRSVRALDDGDARRILELGYAGSLGDLGDYETPPGTEPLLVAERSRRLVEAVTRDARFRRDVMTAYQFTCAITGLSAGTSQLRKAARLLEAAHIRPVSDKGADAVVNGLALTPTVHRLFDAGLVSIRWSGEALDLVVSPNLDARMIEAPERGTRIELVTGAPLILPADRAKWPSPQLVRYHQAQVFQGPESLTT